MRITHNIAAQNTLLHYTTNQRKLLKTTGKLSTGYRINSAADDASGLQISEGMRAQIRGLIRSARNAEEGVQFVQSGDGAMQEISNLIHRMRELSIQSSNDTYTNEDRAAMQAEFNQLQSEIDQINDQTEFNTLPIFEHYTDTFYTFNGNRYWSQDQIHTITDNNNSLTISYQIAENEPEKEMTLTIPNGSYTTQELIDAMDDVVSGLGNSADGLYLEYTRSGFCNMVLQNGETINEISGGLSYLFYDEFSGSEAGILIGTTEFVSGFPLKINQQNNELKFKIEYYTGNIKDINITIPPGNYSRQDMIDYLNSKLSGTGMSASEHGANCIQIGGQDGIITGLKGNMFKIDGKGETVMTSVFYDNTKYGSVDTTAAVFKGGTVLHGSDETYNKFQITNQNNTLALRVNGESTDAYTTITLKNGSYTISDMVTHLQNKLDAAGLKATVTSHSQTVSTANNNTFTFSGLTITSKEEGRHSKIEFDVLNSTAYDTLFVKREYTDTADKITVSSGNFKYTAPTLTGGKAFDNTDFPLAINNTNSSFQIKISEKDASTNVTSSNLFTIQLTEKNYTSLNELLTEINNQLNGSNAPMGLKNKIRAINTSGKIQFTSASGNQSVTGITFSDTSLVGYTTLFVDSYKTTSTKTASNTGAPPSITLDQFDEPVTFDQDEKLVVNVSGANRTATVPAGTYTHQELSEIITKQLKGSTSTTPKSYSAHGEGTTTDNGNKTYSGTGTTTTSSVTCDVKGSGVPVQGTTIETNPTPASYTMPIALKSAMNITNSGNSFKIAVNGNTYSIQLDAGIYTPASLANAINSKLNTVTSTFDKVNVSLNSSNKLTFTTEAKGSATSIAFRSSDSSLIKELATTRSTASTTVGLPLKSSITIDNAGNTFTCQVNGTSHTVTLANGTYSQSSFVTALNNAFSTNGVLAKASIRSGKLVLTTAEAKGNDSSISYKTSDGGSCCNALFGDLVTHTAATATLNIPLLSSIEMKPGENTFIIQTTDAKGAPKKYSLTIPEGTYTQTELVNKMNTMLGGEVTVTKNSGGYLTFTTKAKGAKISLDVNNSISGTAGKAMFGESTVVVPDITATFENKKLKLTGSGTGKSYNISVSSSTSPAFLKPNTNTTTVKPTSTSGSVTTAKYTLRSKNALGSSLKIEDYNKDFVFTYQSPGKTKKVTITLNEKTYSPDDLKTALQEQIDQALGQGALTVSAGSSGITIQATNYGSDYSMTNMSGGFYKYVLQGTVERASNLKPNNTDGRQIVSDTYIIGRKDIKNDTSTITKDLTDTLALDVTINNNVYTLDITLDAKTYNATALVVELQKKLDEAVKAAGLPENCVLVGVGKFNSGVIGNNDANALNFYLNPKVDLEPGEYKIDGLTGDALYEIFYKTSGDLIPAYVEGTKDISRGVTIGDKQTELSFDIDGTTYTYKLQAGKYTTKEFLDMMNTTLSNPDTNGNKLAIKASMSGTSLKLALTKLGEHTINNFAGSATPAIIYQTNSRNDYDSTLYLQVGANANQLLELKRYSVSTISMGINSITVSKKKNAQKAMQRLDEALDYLNTRRSNYGAKENRLEHVIRGNENSSENLQDSESKLRDTDMAESMMELAREQIIQQAQHAMLAQANQINSTVLTLLS